MPAKESTTLRNAENTEVKAHCDSAFQRRALPTLCSVHQQLIKLNQTATFNSSNLPAKLVTEAGSKITSPASMDRQAVQRF
jgi:hypothetical protein